MIHCWAIAWNKSKLRGSATTAASKNNRKFGNLLYAPSESEINKQQGILDFSPCGSCWFTVEEFSRESARIKPECTWFSSPNNVQNHSHSIWPVIRNRYDIPTSGNMLRRGAVLSNTCSWRNYRAQLRDALRNDRVHRTLISIMFHVLQLCACHHSWE